MDDQHLDRQPTTPSSSSPTQGEHARFFQELDAQILQAQREGMPWAEELAERRSLAGTLPDGLDDDDAALDPTRAAELLHRQDALQSEAADVIAALDLPALLAPAGRVEQIGSSVSGLMVWRDLDFNIIAPGLTPERLFAILQPLVRNPNLTALHYQNELGPRSPTGDPRDERYYVVCHYQPAPDIDWKIDLSFWAADAPRGQLAHLAYLRERLTPTTRLAILWIKDVCHRRPSYPYTVGGYEVYVAVLEHGVRTPDAFAAYLRERGLPAD